MHCVKYRRSIVRSKIFWNILFFLKIIIEYSERMCVCVKKWQSKHTCTALMNWKLWIVSVFAVDGILVLKLLCLRSKAIVVYWWTQQLNTIWFELSKHIMNEFDSVEWHCEQTHHLAMADELAFNCAYVIISALLRGCILSDTLPLPSQSLSKWMSI